MQGQDQMELEGQVAVPGETHGRSSTVKTILLHVQNDRSLGARLENALSLARACSAHLSCLHVTPVEAYIAFDSFGGVFVMNDVIKALDEEEAALRARVEERFRTEDVSWDYEQVTGNVPTAIVSRAALADLIVSGRAPHKSDLAGSSVGLLGDLICRSRTPLFIASEDGPACDPAGPALIAWDGSYEAANTVRSAVGLLKLASEVRVLMIDEQKAEAFPNTRLLEYLSRHGVHADLSVESAGRDGRDRQFVSGMLMAKAKALDAYLVMGGYNHSRIGEYVFGGVTRTMLEGALVPLVIGR